jgi:hypothetical protein
MQRRGIAALLTLALSVTACAYYGDYGYGRGDGYERARDYGGYRYGGREFGYDRREGRLTGSGADNLDPWLASTREGQAIVSMGFDIDGDGRIGEDGAHRANIWFRRYADTDRNLELTDEEIRVALVQASRERGRY